LGGVSEGQGGQSRGEVEGEVEVEVGRSSRLRRSADSTRFECQNETPNHGERDAQRKKSGQRIFASFSATSPQQQATSHEPRATQHAQHAQPRSRKTATHASAT